MSWERNILEPVKMAEQGELKQIGHNFCEYIPRYSHHKCVVWYQNGNKQMNLYLFSLLFVFNIPDLMMKWYKLFWKQLAEYFDAEVLWYHILLMFYIVYSSLALVFPHLTAEAHILSTFWPVTVDQDQ